MHQHFSLMYSEFFGFMESAKISLHVSVFFCWPYLHHGSTFLRTLFFTLQQTNQLENGAARFARCPSALLQGIWVTYPDWQTFTYATLDSWKLLVYLSSHPKSAGGWRHGVAEGGRLEWSRSFFKIGNPLIIWRLFQMIYELWWSKILRQCLILWWFCSDPDYILQTTMVKDDIWKCHHQVMYLHYWCGNDQRPEVQ